MTTNCKCYHCNKEVIVGSTVEESGTKLETGKFVCDVGKQEYEIKYYKCPYCKQLCAVQIDNEDTTKLFKDALDQLRTGSVVKSKKIKAKTKKKFESISVELAIERTKLSMWADSKRFVSNNGNILTYSAEIKRMVDELEKNDNTL